MHEIKDAAGLYHAYDASPVDASFNKVVNEMAAHYVPEGYEMSEDAPSTYPELKALLDRGERLIVYSGGSDMTIFAEPEVNYAFRAWHDWCHWKGQHLFTLFGEIGVYRMQQEQLIAKYGDTPQVRGWCKLLYAEVLGQFLYYYHHKDYIDNQKEFVKHFGRDPYSAMF